VHAAIFDRLEERKVSLMRSVAYSERWRSL
jgi:hypothetical protein